MGALIRQVSWKALPLGCVILEGPRVFHAALTELAGYPVLTERLRAELWRKYQLPPQTRVTVVDPSPQLETADFRALDREARTWLDALPPLVELKQGARATLASLPDARRGLASLGRWEKSPYTLTKDWSRSLGSIVRDGGRFGDLLVGPDGLPATVGATVGRLLAGTLPRLQRGCRIDVGVDVSYSMTASGKADFALQELNGVLAPLLARLGAAELAVWSFADGVAPGSSPRPDSSETRFAPFLRRVLEVDRGGPHLAIVVTDGQCRDRPETLRLLERLAALGIDYLQLLLLGEDDLRRMVLDAQGKVRDGVVAEADLEGHTVVVRTEDQWVQAQQEELAAATDLAEAGHGGQLVLTWNPLFRLVALDVYERYLGNLVIRPEGSR